VLAGGLWRIHADQNQLENVLLNLAVNARDAMPDGGRLTIETQNAHLDQRYAASELGILPGQYVLIAVTDSGAGMTEDVMRKAFDPFFTTKDVGKGTGLGLSQVYGFVKQSGGHIKIYSEVGEGTTIKIYLPRHLGPAEDGGDPGRTETPPPADRGELILVVDDEDLVRRFSVEALTELGYRVLEASSAQAALAMILDRPDVDLLFTDIVMPEMNGKTLADLVRVKRPDLPVIYTTGYTRNAVVHNGTLDPDVELISKPFTIEELATRVRTVLEAKAVRR
jgi:CheY-like chemotaxis protein